MDPRRADVTDEPPSPPGNGGDPSAPASVRLEDMFRALWDEAPLSMAFWDRDLRFVRINEIAARSNALPPEDHPGRTFAEVVGEGVAEAAESMLGGVIETGEPVREIDVAARWPSGEEKVFRSSFYPVRGADGEIVGVGAVGLDVTDMISEDAERRMRAADAKDEYGRALLEYMQLVRHRIANPLTTVTAGVRTILDLGDTIDPDTRQELLEAILQEAERLGVVALHPDRRDVSERELDPAPNPVEGPRRATLLRLAGQAEAGFRLRNRERVGSGAAGPDDDGVLDLVCECSSRSCTQPLGIGAAAFAELEDDPASFFVKPGHDVPFVEVVIRRTPGWWLVRKLEEGARASRQLQEAEQDAGGPNHVPGDGDGG